MLEFDDVSFGYSEECKVLANASFALQRGKTYAFVGPTGGGKTTIAMLMARLYDPSSGIIYLAGEDLRTLSPADRARKIGFILQDPILISGTLRDNIVYGAEALGRLDNEALAQHLSERGLGKLIDRFGQGMGTPISWNGSSLSLGEKQLIAFMRAVVREPALLILDEPTANVDTVTETLLGEVLEGLHQSCTKVIIAHRLSTIRKADRIFFVGGERVRSAESLDSAVEMLLGEHRPS